MQFLLGFYLRTYENYKHFVSLIQEEQKIEYSFLQIYEKVPAYIGN